MQTTITKLTTWAQVNISPLQAGRKCLTHTCSRQSFYSNIHHSNEGQLTAVKLEHLMVIITRLYYRLIFLPIEVTYYFFKFSADILFNHGLNSVVLEELQSLENLSILENLTITWPYTAPLVKIIGNPISDGIVFVFQLARWVRGFKRLKWFWPLKLDGLQQLHLDW